MTTEFSQDFFQLFGLPRRFVLDSQQLARRRRYRASRPLCQ
jgi:molecular chaperone HscB